MQRFWRAISTSRRLAERAVDFENKYAAKLLRKAQQEGVDDIATLKLKYANIKKPEKPIAPLKPFTLPRRSPIHSERKDASPIKPLSSILNLDKIASEPSAKVAGLWTGFHQIKDVLSAAIPTTTYKSMLEKAKKTPSFVVPLEKPAQGENGEETGAEMYYLQWAFHPSPSIGVPPVSTVLFTSLAQYKLSQTFAQPTLILTHYTDLASSHDLVLLRGDITENSAMNQADAARLIWLLQCFYGELKDEKAGVRKELLEKFAEGSQQFDVAALVESCKRLAQ